MFKKILKWTGIVLGSLVLLLLVFYGIVYAKTEASINKVYDVSFSSYLFPTIRPLMSLADTLPRSGAVWVVMAPIWLRVKYLPMKIRPLGTSRPRISPLARGAFNTPIRTGFGRCGMDWGKTINRSGSCRRTRSVACRIRTWRP